MIGESVVGRRTTRNVGFLRLRFQNTDVARSSPSFIQNLCDIFGMLVVFGKTCCKALVLSQFESCLETVFVASVEIVLKHSLGTFFDSLAISILQKSNKQFVEQCEINNFVFNYTQSKRKIIIVETYCYCWILLLDYLIIIDSHSREE